MRNYRRRVKFSTSLQPRFPPPFLSPGSLRDLSSSALTVGPEVRKQFPTFCEADGSGWAREPCGEQRGAAEKEAAILEKMPRRGGGGRRKGSRGGAGASGEGAQSPRPGLPPPLPALAADPERLLREMCWAQSSTKLLHRK